MKTAFTLVAEISKDYYSKLDAVLHAALVKEVGEGFDIEALRGRLNCISTPDRVSYYLDETHLATVRKFDLEESEWQP